MVMGVRQPRQTHHLSGEEPPFGLVPHRAFAELVDDCLEGDRWNEMSSAAVAYEVSKENSVEESFHLLQLAEFSSLVIEGGFSWPRLVRWTMTDRDYSSGPQLELDGVDYDEAYALVSQAIAEWSNGQPNVSVEWCGREFVFTLRGNELLSLPDRRFTMGDVIQMFDAVYGDTDSIRSLWTRLDYAESQEKKHREVAEDLCVKIETRMKEGG